MPLIAEGAKEALRREGERDPRIKLTRLEQTGRQAGPLEHGFMKGTVIIQPGVDLTEPIADEPFDAENGVLHR